MTAIDGFGKSTSSTCQSDALKMASLEQLDAHARPPAHVREVFKRCQKARSDWDPQPDASSKPIRVKGDGALPCPDTGSVQQALCRQAGISSSDVEAYQFDTIPGLSYFPSLFPIQAQVTLLDKIFDRDLLDPTHQTNVHAHYEITYPPRTEDSSFFDLDPSLSFVPKDSNCHRPISVNQFLEKKLRWMTLGGQYDWTRKVYPEGNPPAFPADIKALLESVFDIRAEAAIVNLYSPGDSLSLHRDVSESCDRPLVSVSIGCDCIFVIGLDDDDTGTSRVATLRLRSGDAVLMSGKSRFAWHGVPKVIANSCPETLQSWPGQRHAQWDGWLSRKRININVRQMFE